MSHNEAIRTINTINEGSEYICFVVSEVYKHIINLKSEVIQLTKNTKSEVLYVWYFI